MDDRLSILRAVVKAFEHRALVDEIVATTADESERYRALSSEPLGFSRVQADAVLHSTIASRSPESMARVRREIEREEAGTAEDG